MVGAHLHPGCAHATKIRRGAARHVKNTDLTRSAHITFAVRTHVVTLERLERNRWRVSVDGRLLASFCSESRARAAGRIEARRLDFIAADPHRRDGTAGSALD